MPPENIDPGEFRASGNRPFAGKEHLASLRGDLKTMAEGACSCSII
ncbi:hypothetical protein [Castellaniella sp.]|nr:hypothetical protein [Castellaniella sp.]